jgi:AcrR family transcriptional regulator
MPAPAKRPYLASDRRRADLLTAAAQIVLDGGWRALTMKGLAERAGVSRQLVYQHFADQSALLIALTEHLFDRARDVTVAIIEGSEREDAGTLAVRHYEVYLDMPPAQRRVLRAITSEPDVDAPELRRLHRVVRGRMLDLWTPGVRRRTALPPKTARACAWMMTSAAWGLAELVDDGEISRSQARALLGRMAALVLQPQPTNRSRR